MSLGSNISIKRKSLKISQEYVAEQLGVSRQAVSKWEVHGRELGEYYKGGNIYIDTKILESFEYFQEESDNTVSGLIQEIENNSSGSYLTYDEDELIEKLKSLKELICEYELDPEVMEFIEFDEDRYINDLMQENADYMTEDVLDDYVQKFTQQALEIKEDLATNAQDGFIAFDSFLTQAAQTTMDRVDELRGIINE